MMLETSPQVLPRCQAEMRVPGEGRRQCERRIKPSARLRRLRCSTITRAGTVDRLRDRSGTHRRKGVMYTLVAILLLFIVGALFFGEARRSSIDEGRAAQNRVLSLDRFIHNFEQDSERAAYIAGFRSFIAMEQQVASTGDYISDPSETFRGVFLNGTINGTNFTIMQNSSFDEYIARVQYTAGLQGIHLEATVLNVALWQADAWSVMVNYTLSYNVTDRFGTSRWEINKTLIGEIPIVDLRDPLFTAQTYGRVPRVIKKTNSTPFVNDTSNRNDSTGLLMHWNGSYYSAAGRGPSVLMRFAGNISDNPYGIESLVDTDELATQGLAANTSASIVDYLYFNNTPATICTIQTLPSRFKLDTEHGVHYEITGALTSTVCP